MRKPASHFQNSQGFMEFAELSHLFLSTVPRFLFPLVAGKWILRILANDFSLLFATEPIQLRERETHFDSETRSNAQKSRQPTVTKSVPAEFHLHSVMICSTGRPPHQMAFRVLSFCTRQKLYRISSPDCILSSLLIDEYNNFFPEIEHMPVEEHT